MLKIGIDKLLDDNEQMDYAKIDFDTVLGKTDKNGHWLEIEENEASQKDDDEPSSTTAGENSMYMFEGVNYRDSALKADVDLFDQLVLNGAADESSGKAINASKQRGSERQQRRQMTEEEKAARAEKIRETKARRQQEMVREDERHVQWCRTRRIARAGGSGAKARRST